MNTLPAQEIKRRGIAAVDEVIENGDVHIIRNNRLQYVIMTETRYQELREVQEEAFESRLRASLEDLAAGRVRRFESAAELLEALDLEDAL